MSAQILQARSRASVTLVLEKWRLKEVAVMWTNARRLLHYVDMGIARIYRVPICANVILASDSPKLELVKVEWYFHFVYWKSNLKFHE